MYNPHNMYHQYYEEECTMYKYIINGGYKLHGETFVSGSKNASLPILAATIISGRTTRLYNVPDIEDVKITLEILQKIGCKIRLLL